MGFRQRPPGGYRVLSLHAQNFNFPGPDVNCSSSHELSPFTPARFTLQEHRSASLLTGGRGPSIGKCDTYKLLKCFVLPMCFMLLIEMNAAQHTKPLHVTIQIGQFVCLFPWQAMSRQTRKHRFEQTPIKITLGLQSFPSRQSR